MRNGDGPRSSVRLMLILDGIRTGDQAEIVAALEDLSRAHRALAPLAFVVGGFAMLLGGVRILVLNWRLTLVQVLPAVWVWLAMYDLRGHLLHDRSFHALQGPVLVPINLAIVAVTVLAFYLNAVFGFAISQGGVPNVGRAAAEARERWRLVFVTGASLGLALGLTTTVVTRADGPWFAICLSVVTGIMMIAYIAVPSRLIGYKSAAPWRDRLSAGALGGALGFVVSTPPYVLGRIGLLMIGSPVLRIPGWILFALGAMLQAGATSAVRAVKLSAKLGGGGPRERG